MIECFKTYFPSIAEKMTTAYPNGRFEIVVVLNDGSKHIFNSITKSIRKPPRPEDDSELISETMWKKEFALRLYEMLSVKGITQSELAEQTGLNPMTISKYIRGQSTPTAYNLASICRVLGCSISQLIDFEY